MVTEGDALLKVVPGKISADPKDLQGNCVLLESMPEDRPTCEAARSLVAEFKAGYDLH